MTSEDIAPVHCMKTGIAMAIIWGVFFAILLNSGLIDSIDLERAPHLALVVGSLLIMCVGIPASRDPDLRHPLAIFYLILGPVLLGAVLALVAFVGIMSLLSGWNIGSHR